MIYLKYFVLLQKKPFNCTKEIPDQDILIFMIVMYDGPCLENPISRNPLSCIYHKHTLHMLQH